MADRSQRLAIIVVAQDMASKTLRGINGELNRMAGGRGPLAQVTRGAGTAALGLARLGVVAGAAAVGGIVAAAKAGIDFEDAYSGVLKTVEGTPEEMAALYAELRKLATRIPVKFTDLADLATAAGALGVPVEDVARFTEVVSRVVAGGTGLSVEDVADAFGKLGNVLQVHGPDIERMGSTLVQLGNSAASSEADIIDVARRFGAAGQQADLSAAQVLGWSSAISSLGVLPEAAGSALSRLFNNMTRFAATGDAKFKAWAKTANVSVAEFADLVKNDANGAMLLFLKNLSKLDKFEASRTLREAGIINVRDVNAILLLSQNYDLLTGSLNTATTAWDQNTALAEASGKRFDTLKAKLTTFKNLIIDAAVTISEGMNPAIGRAVEKLRAFLSLDTSQSGLKQLGVDIGEAIDKINWAAVLEGARAFAGAMKVVVDIIRQIPPEAIAGLAGFSVANKLSGGLIGQGIGDVIGGTIRAGLDRLFARGAPGNPMFVFVTNPGGLGPPGGRPGGGPGGAPGGARPTSPRSPGYTPRGGGPAIGGAAGAGIAISLDDLNAGFDEYLAKYNATRSTTPPALGVPFGSMAAQQAAMWGEGGRPAAAGEGRALGGSGVETNKKLDVLHQDFLVQRAMFASGGAFEGVVSGIMGGVGDVKTTNSVLTDLKALLARTTDPAQRKELIAAIAKVEGKLDSREWIAAQKQGARDIVASNAPVADKLRELTGIQAAFTARGDTAAAAIIGGYINSLKPHIDAIALAAGRQTITYIAGERAQSPPVYVAPGPARRQPGQPSPYQNQPGANRATQGQVQLNVNVNNSAREGHEAKVTWTRWGGGHPVTAG